MADIKSHQRVNNILLGSLERPALNWLAARLPAWVNPDILTGVGVFGAVLVFLGYILTNYNNNFLWLASLGFIINWYGDSMDGTLARYRNIQRPKYGYFVDHTVDAFNEVLVFLGLGLSPYMRFDLACLLLINYLLVSVHAFVRTAATGVFQISYIRLGPTELRLIAIIANTYVIFLGNPLIEQSFGAFSIFDIIAVILAALLMGVFIFSTLRQARELAYDEQQMLGVVDEDADVGRSAKRVKGSRRGLLGRKRRIIMTMMRKLW
jgi:phosphatidylglycerophosphate synthase